MDTTVVVIGVIAAGWFAVQELKRREAAKRAAEIERTKWRHNDGDREITVDFPTMTCMIEVDVSRFMDGEARYSGRQDATKEWEANQEELEEAGWTHREYMRDDLTCVDLMRKGDGSWESRLLDRYWKRSISRVRAEISGGLFVSSSKRTYRDLTGEDWDVASAREATTATIYARSKEGEISLSEANEQAFALLEGSTQFEEPPWQSVGDLQRLLETAYQRYLHHR